MAMNSKFTDAEARAIMAESREILRRLDDDAADTRPPEISEPTPTVDELLRQPCESYIDRSRRELAARDARWAAQRRQREVTTEQETAAAMAALEARLNA